MAISPIESARHAADVALDPSADIGNLKAAVQALFNEMGKATRNEATDALATLSQGIATPDFAKAAFVAMVCGALIEKGLPGDAIAVAFIGRLEVIIANARNVFDACAAEVPAGAEQHEQIGEALGRLKTNSPEMARAYSALDEFFPPAVALFTSSPAARLRAANLISRIKPMAPFSNGAHWITRVLQVFHEEPYIAIEPSTGIGVAGKMSGISENFQLHVLLMDVFPHSESAPKRRIDESIVDIVRGNGPQQSKFTVNGWWNLYTWRAIRKDGTLPDSKDRDASKQWIWGEGIPADIPVFEGSRVILLGPPAYKRGWGAQRDFSTLHAELSIEHELSADEVKVFLTRLATAPR